MIEWLVVIQYFRTECMNGRLVLGYWFKLTSTEVSNNESAVINVNNYFIAKGHSRFYRCQTIMNQWVSFRFGNKQTADIQHPSVVNTL
jgi:hypothetical protein